MGRWKLPSSTYASPSIPLAPDCPSPSRISATAQVRCEHPPLGGDISDLPAHHLSARHVGSMAASPLTSAAAVFFPLFLLAPLFPHGLRFYLGACDCI